jgi:hypothetical protein
VKIAAATQVYEAWLGRQIELVPDDLEKKHELMRKSPFVFLRATYYRWLQRVGELVPELAAPELACVGDLHVENFGTWRDAEGRLVWGINDFDESERLPYTYDLARLATSALLAIEEDKLPLSPRAACAAVLDGYRTSLEAGGGPFVLAGEHRRLARMVAKALGSDPASWWKELLDANPRTPEYDSVPGGAAGALEAVLPAPGWNGLAYTRVAGAGSLGHRRIVYVGPHEGAPVAREIKQLAPPSGVWLERGSTAGVSIAAAVRSQDPFVHVAGGWVARRIAPDCVKLDLRKLQRGEPEPLLGWMGAETANIHLASTDDVAAVRADLGGRGGEWLHDAAVVLADATRKDYNALAKKR